MIEWRSIPGFPSYEASSDGQIRRIITRAGNPCRRIKKLFRDKRGYLGTVLHENDGGKSCLAHRAVCLAFYGEPPTPDHQVAHWNGDRGDNRKENVRWALPIENADDRTRHGRTARGERGGNSVLSDDQVREIRRVYTRRPFSNVTILASRYNVSRSTIFLIVKRKIWKHVLDEGISI